MLAKLINYLIMRKNSDILAQNVDLGLIMLTKHTHMEKESHQLRFTDENKTIIKHVYTMVYFS